MDVGVGQVVMEGVLAPDIQPGHGLVQGAAHDWLRVGKRLERRIVFARQQGVTAARQVMGNLAGTPALRKQTPPPAIVADGGVVVQRRYPVGS